MAKTALRPTLVKSDTWPDIARLTPCATGSLRALQEKSLAALQLGSLPDPTHELWRYTRPSLFEFMRLTNQGTLKFALRDFAASKEAALGSEVRLLTNSDPDLDSLIQKVIDANAARLAGDAYSALQLAMCTAVCGLRVPRGKQIEKVLRLSQFVSASAAQSVAPLIIIELEQGASISLLEDLDFEFEGLFAPRIELFAADGAHFEFTSIQRLPDQAAYAGRHMFHIGRDVRGKVLHLCLGARAARLDLECCLNAPGSEVELYAFYLADKKRHVDFHPTQSHCAPHCKSELYYKGALTDRGRSVYYGYIQVEEGAQKSDAYQANRNLLLSSEARADSIPNLRIQANDVRCSHGSSIGQVGSDELFYLMSRGLSREQAERLLVEGFFEDLLARVKNSEIRDYASRLILDRINGKNSSA